MTIQANTWELEGSVPAVITIMEEGGNKNIDYQAYAKHVEWLICNGSSALVVAGTTGESPTLTNDEFANIIKTTIETRNKTMTYSSKFRNSVDYNSPDKSKSSGVDKFSNMTKIYKDFPNPSYVPVILSCGVNCTATTKVNLQIAIEAGADGAIICMPYYNKPPQRGVVLHMQSLCDFANLICSQYPRPAVRYNFSKHAVGKNHNLYPIIMYNVPNRTGFNLEPETIGDICKVCHSVIGIKEASGTMERLQSIQNLKNSGKIPSYLKVLTGDDVLTIQAILNGYACGSISVTANIFPYLIAKNIDLALHKDKKAQAIDDACLKDLHEKLFVETNPMPIKYLVAKIHETSHGIRLPLVTLTPENQSIVLSAYKNSLEKIKNHQ